MSSALVLISGFLLGKVFAGMGKSGNPAGQPGPLPRAARGALEDNPYEWRLLRSGPDVGSLGVLNVALTVFFATMLVASVVTRHWQEGFITAFFKALAIHLIAKLRFAIEATRQINADLRSGTLELLLVTTLPDTIILEGHQRALRIIGYRPLGLLIGLNTALELFVLGFPQILHMDSEATLTRLTGLRRTASERA